MSQVHSLCNLDLNPPSVNSGLGPYCDELIRARIFWYAYVHEAIITGLDGGRLLLYDNSDLLFRAISDFAVLGMMTNLLLFRAVFPLSIVHHPPTASPLQQIRLALRHRPPVHLLRQRSLFNPL